MNTTLKTLVLSLILMMAAEPGTAQETSASHRELPDTLKVMTFNVLYATPDQGTIRAMKASDADIIGVQEISEPRLEYIARELGYYYHHNGDHEASFENDTGILSRYPISRATHFGATIYLTVDDPIHIYNVHLSAYPYEPYDLRDGKLTVKEAIEQARFSRYPEIQPVLEAMQEQLKRGEPVFLTGDFNEPSHLDWTQKASDAGLHLDKVVEWPISKEIARHGLKDTWRSVYPNEVKHPGQTWTTLENGPDEVHDRIDIVYYSGEGVEAVDAKTLGLRENEPTDIAVSGYPSDHRSVVGVFLLK